MYACRNTTGEELIKNSQIELLALGGTFIFIPFLMFYL